MKQLTSNSLALIASLAVTMVIVLIFHAITSFFLPFPRTFGWLGWLGFSSITRILSIPATLLTELGYIAGSFAGGFAIGKLASSYHSIIAIALGCILSGINMINIMSIPHPTWLIILTFIIFNACSLSGLFLSR